MTLSSSSFLIVFFLIYLLNNVIQVQCSFTFNFFFSRHSAYLCLFNQLNNNEYFVTNTCGAVNRFHYIFDENGRLFYAGKSSCLEASDTAHDSLILMRPCSNSSLQQFEYTPDEFIRLKNTDLCIGFNETATPIVKAIRIRPCNINNPAVKWYRQFTCPPGTEANIGFNGCNVCPDGFYKTATSNFDKCTPCPPGFVSTEDYSGCEKCPSGRCSWTYEVTQFVGSGSPTSVDGQGTLASFFNAQGMAFDSNDILYVADSFGRRIRRINQTGFVTTIAGSGTVASAEGQGRGASFSLPTDVYPDNMGNLYVVDNEGHRIFMINATAYVSFWAGNGVASLVHGNRLQAAFNKPRGVTLINNTMYISEDENRGIRLVNMTSGEVSPLSGYIYTPGSHNCFDGPFNSATFLNPYQISTDGDGNLIVSDISCMARKLNMQTKQVSSMAVPKVLSSVTDIVFDKISNRYYTITSINDDVSFVLPNGFTKRIANSTLLQNPYGIAVDSKGDIYASSTASGSHRILKIFSCPPFSIWDNQSRTCPCLAGYLFQSPKSCIPCPDGTYMNTTTLTGNNRTCIPCPLETETAPLRTSCVPCIEGVKYIPDPTNAICVDCPVNSVCTKFGFQCQPGFTLSQDKLSCSACPLDHYKSTVGNHSCIRCPAGTEPNTNRSSCTSCLPGKFKPTLSFIQCADCPVNAKCTSLNMTCMAGFQQSPNNTYSCDQCPQNYFKETDGNEDCMKCTPGTFSSDDFQSCIKCPAGMVSRSVNTTCEQCGIGLQPLPNRTDCEPCPAGTFKNIHTLTSCMRCPSNAICDTMTLTCKAGYTLNPQKTGCMKCFSGYYKPDVGNQTCLLCEIGSESTSDGIGCRTCLSGYYRPTLAYDRCIQCPFDSQCTPSSFTCREGWKLNQEKNGCDMALFNDNEDGIRGIETARTTISSKSDIPWIGESSEAGNFLQLLTYYLIIPLSCGLFMFILVILVRKLNLFSGDATTMIKKDMTTMNTTQSFTEITKNTSEVPTMEYVQDLF